MRFGNRFELYNDDAEACAQRYPSLLRWSGAKAEHRKGFCRVVSWRLDAKGGLLTCLRKHRQRFVYVEEEGYLPGGMKRRVLRLLYHPELVPSGFDDASRLATDIGLTGGPCRKPMNFQ